MDIDLLKYEILDSLVIENNGPKNINMADIYHVKPASKNYREIASVWEAECSKDKAQFYRLSAFIQGKAGNKKEQISLLSKACMVEAGVSCFTLLTLNEMSKEEVKNYKSKIENECENNQPNACYFVGNLMLMNYKSKDFKAANKYFKVACEANFMVSSTDLRIVELESYLL